MASKVTTNMEKTRIGNGIKAGSTLRINIRGAAFVSGAIYKNGFPILAIFGKGQTASIKLARKGKNIRGLAVLKLRWSDKRNRGFGIDDAFIIL